MLLLEHKTSLDRRLVTEQERARKVKLISSLAQHLDDLSLAEVELVGSVVWSLFWSEETDRFCRPRLAEIQAFYEHELSAFEF